MQPGGDGDGGVQSARLAGVSLCRRCTGPLSHRRDRAGGDAELSVRAGRGAAVVHGRTGILPRTLLARSQDSADGGRSADDRRGPAADPAIDVAGAARPERRAARHCGGHVVHGAGQPTTGRPRRAHHPPRPQCHRRAGLSGPGQRAPAGLAGDLGARRVAEDRACAARSIRCAAAVRGSGPRLAPSVAWPAGLGGAAGPRGIVRARLLVRGGGCRRRCARGRRIRRPGGLTRRDGAGRERLPAPHGKPPQAVSRCAVGPVLRDHRPAAGCRADRGSTAGGTGLAAGLGASQDGAELSGAARNPPVGARRLAHRHRAGAWRRVCAAAPGHGHAAALGCRQRGATDAGRAGAEHGVGAAPDPTP